MLRVIFLLALIALVAAVYFLPWWALLDPSPKRLRMVIGVTPGTQRLCYRYYFEDFGEVNLPESEANR